MFNTRSRCVCIRSRCYTSEPDDFWLSRLGLSAQVEISAEEEIYKLGFGGGGYDFGGGKNFGGRRYFFPTEQEICKLGGLVLAG